MRVIIILFFILCINTSAILSSTLYVGIYSQNENLVFSDTIVSYDSIIVLNKATVTFLNSTVNVRSAVYVLNNANFYTINSTFNCQGNFISTGTSKTIISGTANLFCNIIALDNSKIELYGLYLNVPMKFKDQFFWELQDSSTLEVKYVNANFGLGAISGNSKEQSNFLLNVVTFTTNQMPFSWSLSGSSNVLSDSVSFGQEWIISDSASLSISNADYVVIWNTYSKGDTVLNYQYPPSNGTFPNASNLSGKSYDFNNSLIGIKGVKYSIHIENIPNVFWGMLLNMGADVSLLNSTLISCGFLFTDVIPKNNYIYGFYNDSTYSGNFNTNFKDRSLSLTNSKIVAWNFYAIGNDTVTIENSIYGESWTFLNGVFFIKNSICDGTGGSVSIKDNGKLFAENCQFIREYNKGIQIINMQNNGFCFLNNCYINSTVSLSGHARMFANNSIFDSIPKVSDYGLFSLANIDSVGLIKKGDVIDIKGKIELIKGLLSTNVYSEYKVFYSNTDSTNFKEITSVSFTSMNFEGILTQWNTDTVNKGEYLLWLITMIDNDTANICSEKICIQDLTATYKNRVESKSTVWSNNGTIHIKAEPGSNIYIYNSLGQMIINHHMQTNYEMYNLPQGFYLINVNESVHKVIN